MRKNVLRAALALVFAAAVLVCLAPLAQSGDSAQPSKSKQPSVAVLDNHGCQGGPLVPAVD
jgi:hypothetical protein